MSHIRAESHATWTAFPSLLGGLQEAEHRQALEDAAQAHYCGRYHDAEAIFASRLPQSHTVPVTTLQRADMLTTQGCESDRVELLRAALTASETTPPLPANVRLLMNFMLADAEFWTYGRMDDVVALLPTIRAHVEECKIEHMTDIEVITCV